MACKMAGVVDALNIQEIASSVPLPSLFTTIPPIVFIKMIVLSSSFRPIHERYHQRYEEILIHESIEKY